MKDIVCACSASFMKDTPVVDINHMEADAAARVEALAVQLAAVLEQKEETKRQLGRAIQYKKDDEEAFENLEIRLQHDNDELIKNRRGRGYNS